MNPREPIPPHAPAPGPVAFGPFVLDAAEARLVRDGQALALNGRPLAVLAVLAARPGQLVEKDAVLDAVWGHRHVSESVLKGAVNTLRAALGDDAKAPLYIETVPRRGYRFVATLRPLGGAAPAAAAVVHAAAPAATLSTETAAETSAAVPRPGNLPPPLPGLVGRAACAAQLHALLRQHRLVTLTGLGGIGKTRLALAAAHALDSQEAPADGSWLLRLDALAEGAPLASSVAQTLRLGAGAGSSDAHLARALAPLRLRLVLDNAEHLAEPLAALLATLLDAAPGLSVLVTSQMPLRLAGEQVLLLAPLSLPSAIEDAAPDPAGYAAAHLFVERVRMAQPGYAPAAAEHADIAAICRALDGVPLALELAAARVPLLGVAGVRARLDQRFALLTRGPRDAAARHRTLSAALDWTHGLLSPTERVALHHLALFHGSFTAEAAETLVAHALADEHGGAEQAIDLVDALHERSLLVSDATPEGPRLRLFDSVRRHALQRMADDAGPQGEAAARARHLAWTRQCFEAGDLADFTTPQLQWLPALRLEVDNLRAALQLGLAPEAMPALLDQGLRLLAVSPMFWFRSGLRAEGWRWMQQGRLRLAQADAAGQAVPDETRALVDHGLGLFINYVQLGAPADGMAALHRSRPALQRAQDHRRVYLSLYSERMLMLRLNPGDPATALRDQMRALQQPHWGALSRRFLAMLDALALRDAGDADGFQRACAAGARLLRQAGGRAEAWSLEGGVAQGLALAGRLDEARTTLDAALDDVQRAGMLREQMPMLAMSATLHLLADAGPATMARARQAVQVLHAEGMLWWMADALPFAAWHQGRHGAAASLQAWADALVQARGDSRGPVFRMVRQRFETLLNAHPDAAALRAAASSSGPALDEAAAITLAGCGAV